MNFDELWELLITQDESVEIEAKKASQVGKSCWETISAFSNEPGLGGGYLILGIISPQDSQTGEYEIEGIRDPDKIQCDLASQCSQVFSSIIRPRINVATKDGNVMIFAFIPEAPASEKPVYIKRRGLPQGAFRRIASTDQKCTDKDIEQFYQERSYQTFDQTPLKEASLEELESQAIDTYRRLRKEANPNASELSYSDRDLLNALFAIARHPDRRDEDVPTIAGMLLFGKEMALRRYFPMHRVDYIVVQGREWIADPDKRYQSVVEIREPLLLAIPKLTNLVLNDLPKAFNLPEGEIIRRDIPLIPRKVIREAIVNAVMHRNYREKQPIQIIRFSDRLEIRNPGYSLKSPDELDQPGSKTRNEKIAGVLHDLNIAETKGSGIRTIFEEMLEANLTLPLFVSNRDRDYFHATLFTHHLLDRDDREWLKQFKDYDLNNSEAKALVVLRKVGSINNLVYRVTNDVDTVTASQHLIKMRNAGLLESHGKGSATYYTLHPNWIDETVEDLKDFDLLADNDSSTDNGLSVQYNSTDNGLSVQYNSTDKKTYLEQMPEKLRCSVKELGQRVRDREKMRDLILALCKWRDLSSRELAIILDRKQGYLLNQYLNPLITSGSLVYTIPESPNDPTQSYRSV